ncbi:carbohydrate kinase [Siculibacillus lacustris]|uniref:Carbohydrate kinase n=1 Tax=Siculibacillus lacustris TaxID=1549641 RepID=A0A4V2KTK4_9HYPH|nr:FGGY-family carbohydrate kinase [Siculibacillus lacustris]TBW37624.1 carbohydrate kinase [Siculibacillus lacustris]
MSLVIGVDGGTESLRARVFDLSGRCLGTAASPYETRFSAGARAEQDPDDWWRAIGVAVRGAVADAGVAPTEIAAMSLATTCCSVVVLDAAGRALRPAIIWMDVRASAEADAVLATGDEALAVNGAGHGPVSAEWMIPKALWLARNELEVFARAVTVCEYQDFLNLHLTGRRVASLDNASIRWHWSSRRPGGAPLGLLEKLGLSALAVKWPAEVLAPGAPIGPLTAAAAAHLGLPQTVQVVQGGADALIGMIGLGVAQPGQLALITGSSHLQFGVADRPVSIAGLWGAYPDAVYPGRFVIEGGQTSTGSILAWLGRLSGGTLDYAALEPLAAALEPGSDGLFVLDHFQGNRTPHTDPLSRGAIVGLTLAHGLPHLMRAVMEGIAFGTRAILDRMAEAGFTSRELVVGGGATQSNLWLQIHADVAGLPVVVPESTAAPALGCAVLAGVGIGAFATIDDGIAAMVRPGRRIEPRPREVALYDALHRRWLGLYPALKPFRPS